MSHNIESDSNKLEKMTESHDFKGVGDFLDKLSKEVAPDQLAKTLNQWEMKNAQAQHRGLGLLTHDLPDVQLVSGDEAKAINAKAHSNVLDANKTNVLIGERNNGQLTGRTHLEGAVDLTSKQDGFDLGKLGQMFQDIGSKVQDIFHNGQDNANNQNSNRIENTPVVPERKEAQSWGQQLRGSIIDAMEERSGATTDMETAAGSRTYNTAESTHAAAQGARDLNHNLGVVTGALFQGKQEGHLHLQQMPHIAPRGAQNYYSGRNTGTNSLPPAGFRRYSNK